jgi:hypothetical protein
MKDDSRERLRSDLLAGAASKPAKPADLQYFVRLRQRISSKGKLYKFLD